MEPQNLAVLQLRKLRVKATHDLLVRTKVLNFAVLICLRFTINFWNYEST
jgi:hypothetical protein